MSRIILFAFLLKRIYMIDDVYSSATSWEQVKELTAAKSWLKLLGVFFSTEPDPPQRESDESTRGRHQGLD